MAAPVSLSITSANAVYLISVDTVFPTPQRLQGWSVDEAFDTEVADMAEVQLGVDGNTAAGWVPRLTTQTLTLLANSPSNLIFEQWVTVQDTQQAVFQANGVIILPGIKRKYSLQQGTLTRYPAIANARRVLAPRQYTILWSWPIISGPV